MNRLTALILCLCLLQGCASFPATAGKNYSYQTERNWQIINAIGMVNTLAKQDCLQGKVPTFAGLVVDGRSSRGEVIGLYVMNAVVHYFVSEAMYYSAPDRMWRAWNFSTQGNGMWDVLATYKNC